MNDLSGNERINPGHTGVRNFLRIIGPMLAIVGGLFLATGMISFFSSFGSFGGGPPRYFWCCFVGMPLLALGMMLTKLGYFGAISRYFAGEAAPVAADTFNYMAEETKPGVTHVASAIREGLTGAVVENGSKSCPSCHHANDNSAGFCNQCGTKLQCAVEIDCPACQTPNDPGARFCDFCGDPLTR